AHAEHRPDLGEPQHLGHGAAAIHMAGRAVADMAGFAHFCFSRRITATNSRALTPGARPSAAACALTRDTIPSSKVERASPMRALAAATVAAAIPRASSAGSRPTPASSMPIPASLKSAAKASYL